MKEKEEEIKLLEEPKEELTIMDIENKATESNRNHSHTGKSSPRVKTDNLFRDKETRVRAYLSGTQNTTHNTLTKINLNVESFDERGEFSITGYKFTAHREGYYLVIANVVWGLGGTEDKFMAHIYKNGATISNNSAISSNYQEPTNNLVDIVHLVPDDYIELYAEQESGDTIGVISGSANTFLAITKLFPI